MKNGDTVDNNLVSLIAKIGEKITIGKTQTIKNSTSINSHYLHTVVKDNLAKLAVIVSLETKDNSETVKNFGKQLSMHIAASNPLCKSPEDIDNEVLEREKAIFETQARESGKDESIMERMVEGKVRKFLAEASLISQAFIKDPDITVGNLLDGKKTEVIGYVRFKVGEGIEIESKSFADEVAEQLK